MNLFALILLTFFFVSPLALGSEGGKIIREAEKHLSVREDKGSNRSKDIDAWNKFTGAPMGSPYCASFVSYVHFKAGVKGPRSAWSPSCVASKNISFSQIEGGDVFGLYFSSKKRVAHTGFIKKAKGGLVYTIEANTSPDASSGSAKDRDGDGVFNKIRSKFLMKNSKNKYSRYWK